MVSSPLTDDTTAAVAGDAVPLTLPEDPTDLRLALHRNGYRPVPVLGAHVAMKAAGKTEFHELTAEEKEAWRAALLPVREEMAGHIGADLIKSIEAATAQ